MVPDRGFTKQLKTLDEDLEVVWDYGNERWEIWKFPKDGRDSYCVTRIQTEDKDYRALGADVLLRLQQSIQFGPKKMLAYLEEHNNQLRRRREAEFRDKVEQMALDAWGPLFTLSCQVPKNYEIKTDLKQKVMEVM